MPGLKLELNIEQYEYPSERLTDEAGVRVFVGNQHLMPFPYELGISESWKSCFERYGHASDYVTKTFVDVTVSRDQVVITMLICS